MKNIISLILSLGILFNTYGFVSANKGYTLQKLEEYTQLKERF